MENFPGPNPEMSPAEGGTKRSKKRSKRRVNVSLGPMVRADGASVEGASEKPTREGAREPISLDRELVKLMVRRKLQEGRGSREEGEPETDKILSEDGMPHAPVDRSELLGDAAIEVAKDESTIEQLQESSEDDHEEEQVQSGEMAYEQLHDYEVGANEFIGDVVISLRGPVEEHIVSSESFPEKVVELSGRPVRRTARLTEAGPPTEHPGLATGEVAPIPAGAGGGDLPPPQPPEVLGASSDEPPERSTTAEAFTAMRNRLERERNIYVDYGAPAEIVNHRAVEAEDRVTKEELDDAVYYATKAGQNRGVAAGLLVGAGYEHFKHKRREKKAEEEYRAQTKQFKKAEQTSKIHAEEQEQRNNELERRLQTAEPAIGEVEGRPQKQSVEQAHAEKQPVIVPKQAEAESLQVPPEHYMQASAWHSIEIDAKTGRPVENPTFAYGEEYHKERAQESMPVVQDGTTTRETIARPVAAGQQNSSLPGDSMSLPPVGLPSASTQGPPPSVNTKAVRPTAKTNAGQTTGPLWPWLVALLAIIISLVLILR